ncbi:TPA: hypothetical protein HA244_00325 [Candidatus Micrarchaeota archaeon]|nr:hypothetical protein [Candidatus Micrarchaeota archaeon]
MTQILNQPWYVRVFLWMVFATSIFGLFIFLFHDWIGYDLKRFWSDIYVGVFTGILASGVMNISDKKK